MDRAPALVRDIHQNLSQHRPFQRAYAGGQRLGKHRQEFRRFVTIGDSQSARKKLGPEDDLLQPASSYRRRRCLVNGVERIGHLVERAARKMSVYVLWKGTLYRFQLSQGKQLMASVASKARVCGFESCPQDSGAATSCRN